MARPSAAADACGGGIITEVAEGTEGSLVGTMMRSAAADDGATVGTGLWLQALTHTAHIAHKPVVVSVLGNDMAILTK